MVSVVTSTWQRRELLRRCVDSVRRQTFRDLEHIIVSDGPSDDPLVTLALERNYADWGATPRREGVKLARGEYVAFLDDDNEWLPEHISSLVELIERHGADFVFSDDSRHISNGQPEWSHIDTSCILCRRDLVTRQNWRPAGYAADWDLVRRWLKHGATWACSGKPTVIYSGAHA